LRYYSIVITDPKTGKVRLPPGAPSGQRATYTSLNAAGLTSPGALNVEMDIPVTTFAAPDGDSGAYVKVWGVSLAEISQAADLNNQQVAVYGGMQKGLPLATAAFNDGQAGLLVQGYVFQAFGNWVSTEQSLDIVIKAGEGPTPGAKNLVLNWKKGVSLGDALKSTLTTAFPGYTADINISPKLVFNQDETGYYSTVTELADYVRQASLAIIGGKTYAGVDIQLSQTKFTVRDGTTSTTPKKIKFQDMIGQPTWIQSPLIQVKTVMRSDIKLGDSIQLPPALITNTAAAQSSLVNQRANFQGSFTVQRVQHFGHFRQPDAASWNTTFDAAPASLS
jgi:hypothetical protein